LPCLSDRAGLSSFFTGQKNTSKQGKIMARITVEDCLKKVDNRFGLIHLSAKRVRQLRKGVEPLVVCKNKDIVVSLREIAKGKVFQTDEESRLLIESEEASIPEELPEKTPDASVDQEQGDQEPKTESE
jgi:DNA-directed RNA polymerase subunit omega